MSSAESGTIVEVEALSKRFGVRMGLLPVRTRRFIEAVNDLSFKIRTGGSTALVGESGSGKTTTARVIVGLERPSSGHVRIAGRALGPLRTSAQRRDVAKLVQMVFQDPYVSLDPRQTVARMLTEVLRFHTSLAREPRELRLAQLVDSVGLPKRALKALPRELSGGQRQRAAIARALASEPRVLVLDEAVSALDTSVQAQILNLLADLREEFALSYLVITHDLAVARQISEEVVVMYRGRGVETGRTEEVLGHPQHPYTQELLDCVPRPGMSLHSRIVSTTTTELEGCPFRARCPREFHACVHDPPVLPASETRKMHRARCWLLDPVTSLPPGKEVVEPEALQQPGES